MSGLRLMVLLIVAGTGSAAASADQTSAINNADSEQTGKASFYGPEFDGKKMADGTRLDQRSEVAASKTLPIGTEAKVTNLKNGKSTTVKVADRGPVTKGRIIDLTESSAAKLGMKQEGVAPVVVKPVAVPPHDGSPEPGVGTGTAATAASAQK